MTDIVIPNLDNLLTSAALTPFGQSTCVKGPYGLSELLQTAGYGLEVFTQAATWAELQAMSTATLAPGTCILVSDLGGHYGSTYSGSLWMLSENRLWIPVSGRLHLYYLSAAVNGTPATATETLATKTLPIGVLVAGCRLRLEMGINVDHALVANVTASGAVTFHRTVTTNPVRIYPGTIVSIAGGTKQYTVTANPAHAKWILADGGCYDLEAGEANIIVPVTCTAVGVAGNTAINTVTAFVLPATIADVDTVNNAIAFTNGVAAESMLFEVVAYDGTHTDTIYSTSLTASDGATVQMKTADFYYNGTILEGTSQHNTAPIVLTVRSTAPVGNATAHSVLSKFIVTADYF